MPVLATGLQYRVAFIWLSGSTRKFRPRRRSSKYRDAVPQVNCTYLNRTTHACFVDQFRRRCFGPFGLGEANGLEKTAKKRGSGRLHLHDPPYRLPALRRRLSPCPRLAPALQRQKPRRVGSPRRQRLDRPQRPVPVGPAPSPFKEWPITRKQYNAWTGPQSWLYTTAEFDQFDPHAEYLNPSGGNSGISIRDTSRAKYALTGPDHDCADRPTSATKSRFRQTAALKVSHRQCLPVCSRQDRLPA